MDETLERQKARLAAVPDSPRKRAIDLMHANGVDFMKSAELIKVFDIKEKDAAQDGKKLAQLLGVKPVVRPGGLRGYELADLTTAVTSGS